MSDIVYPPISYPGTADIVLDLTGELETGEVLTGTQTAVSSDTDALTTGSVTINSGALTKKNGGTIAIGKAVQFRVTSVASITRDVSVAVTFAGDDGTTGTFTIYQQVKPTLP